jgi:hypothetical protein
MEESKFPKAEQSGGEKGSQTPGISLLAIGNKQDLLPIANS